MCVCSPCSLCSFKFTRDQTRISASGHGASFEETAAELDAARERFEKAEEEVKEMEKLNMVRSVLFSTLVRAILQVFSLIPNHKQQAANNSFAVRVSEWQKLRQDMARRCNVLFGSHLSERGYGGDLVFDDEAKTLVSKVWENDQMETQDRERQKYLRLLSGGEKSFSMICFLLSLWKSTPGSPLCCLGEDVF